MDSVFIRGLAIDTTIGVADWERRLRQRLLVDVSLQADLRAAGRSDALADAIDYAAVSERIRTLAAASEFRLVEALAEAIAADLLTRWPATSVRITLTKPGAVAGTAGVGVTLEREREDSA
jgi:dihydroneopterin aldolase